MGPGPSKPHGLNQSCAACRWAFGCKLSWNRSILLATFSHTAGLTWLFTSALCTSCWHKSALQHFCDTAELTVTACISSRSPLDCTLKCMHFVPWTKSGSSNCNFQPTDLFVTLQLHRLVPWFACMYMPVEHAQVVLMQLEDFFQGSSLTCKKGNPLKMQMHSLTPLHICSLLDWLTKSICFVCCCCLKNCPRWEDRRLLGSARHKAQKSSSCVLMRKEHML